MLTINDIKKAVADKIRSKYNYKIYRNDVKEGYERPSFFIRVLPILTNLETANLIHSKVTVEITYFQQQKSEVDNLQKAEDLRQLFTGKLAVNERQLTIEDLRIEFAGQEDDVLQVLFDLDYYDAVTKTDTYDIMRELKLSEVNE